MSVGAKLVPKEKAPMRQYCQKICPEIFLKVLFFKKIATNTFILTYGETKTWGDKDIAFFEIRVHCMGWGADEPSVCGWRFSARIDL